MFFGQSLYTFFIYVIKKYYQISIATEDYFVPSFSETTQPENTRFGLVFETKQGYFYTEFGDKKNIF